MDRIKAQRIKDTAYRTIKIVDLVMEGKETMEIVDQLSGFRPRVERQLVNYYKEQLK